MALPNKILARQGWASADSILPCGYAFATRYYAYQTGPPTAESAMLKWVEGQTPFYGNNQFNSAGTTFYGQWLEGSVNPGPDNTYSIGGLTWTAQRYIAADDSENSIFSLLWFFVDPTSPGYMVLAYDADSKQIVGGCTIAPACSSLVTTDDGGPVCGNSWQLLPVPNSEENLSYIIGLVGPLNNGVMPNLAPDLATFAANFKGYDIPDAPAAGGFGPGWNPAQVCNAPPSDPLNEGPP